MVALATSLPARAGLLYFTEFDNPPFIGPYAEFGFRVDLRSLRPPDEDPEAAPEASDD